MDDHDHDGELETGPLIEHRPLLQLAGALGIAREPLVAGEAVRRLEARSRPIQKDDVPEPTADTWNGFFAAYGNDASVTLMSGDTKGPGLTAGPATGDPIAAWQAAKRRAPANVSIAIRLEKPAAANRFDFVFYDSLVQTFADSFSLNPLGTFDPLQRLVITVGDRSLDVHGPQLSIRGVGSSGSHPSSMTDLEKRRELHERLVGIDDSTDVRLTPWNLHLESHATRQCPEIAGPLAGRALYLALQYLADRVRQQTLSDGTVRTIVEFMGVERSLSVALVLPRLAAWYSGKGNDTRYDAAFDVLDWCFEDKGAPAGPNWTRERLNFVQGTIARQVPPGANPDTAGNTIEVVGNLAPHRESFWKAYTDGEMERYLSTVADMESTVGTAIDVFGARAADITDNVSKGVLGAVAALIGSAIAAAFKTPFNEDLFRIGMIVYLAYFVVFPFLLGTISILRRWQATMSHFELRRREFVALLGDQYVEDNVDARTGPPVRTFWVMFVVSILLYTLVIALMVYLIGEVPRLAAG